MITAIGIALLIFALLFSAVVGCISEQEPLDRGSLAVALVLTVVFAAMAVALLVYL